MSISQLDDPAMREALGIETNEPSVFASPVLVEQNGDPTDAARIGHRDYGWVANDGSIVNFATYIDAPPTVNLLATELECSSVVGVVGGLTISNCDQISAETGGGIVLQSGGGDVSSSFGNVLDGTVGHALSFTGSSGRLYMTADGQFAMNHLSPATKTGTQLLFRPSYAQAISVANTPVGGTGQVILPISSLTNSSSAGGQPMWGVASPNLVLNATYGEAGVYLVTATVQVDTATGGTQTATAHFKLNGNDVINSASRHSINQNGEDTVVIKDILTLAVGDAISVALTSTDAAMTATTYAASAGPPSVPQAPAVVLSAIRIA
jgi:hypothetical protein